MPIVQMTFICTMNENTLSMMSPKICKMFIL